MTARATAGAVTFGALAIAACVLAPTPADATEVPAPGVTAVWYAQGTDQWPTDGQTLSAHTSSTALDLAFVQSTADALGCGFTIQGDLYADDATTAALIAAGKLFAGGTAAESWPGGQYLPEFSTVFYTGDCVAAVDPQPTDTAAPVDTTTRDTVSDIQAATKPVPELAATGVDMATPTGVAFLLIVGGLILWSVKFMKKRESK